MSPPKGSSKRATAAAADGGALTANVAAGGTTAASRAPAGLPDAVRDQHTHVTSGPDLNYNVSFSQGGEGKRKRKSRKGKALHRRLDGGGLL